MSKATFDPDQYTMSFGEHIEELRRRLIRAIAGIAVASIFTFWYGRAIIAWLCEPLFEVQRQLGLSSQLINLSPITGFGVYVKVATVAAVVVAAPWIVYQIWSFIAAGLYDYERRVGRLVGPMSLLMTVLSVLFLYYIFLPGALTFLLGFTVNYPEVDTAHVSTLSRVTSMFGEMNKYLSFGMAVAPPKMTASTTTAPAGPLIRVTVLPGGPPGELHDGDMWFDPDRNELRLYVKGQKRSVALQPTSLMAPTMEVNAYLNFVMWLALLLAASFQLPVVMTFLGGVGLVEASALAKYRKYVVFALFAICVLLTPQQDIFANGVLPLLLWGLFELGLVMMRIAKPRKRAEADEGEGL